MRKIFVILMLMIALPVVALAGGWILWDEVYIQPEKFAIVFKKPNPQWQLVYAYNSYEVCQEKVLAVAKAEENGWRGMIGKSFSDEKPWSDLKLIEVIDLGIGSYMVIWQAKGGEPMAIIHDFQCFPASFDPRK